MKIYNKIVIEISSGDVIFEDSLEYKGEVLECKGGGTSTTNTVKDIDYAYNSRMAAIAEEQQGMAQEYFDYWKATEKPYETAQIAANTELMPGEVALAKEQNALSLEKAGSQRELLPQQTNIAKSYYDEVLGGVNVGEKMGMARSDVQQATSLTEGERRREFSRMGVDPSSPAFASLRSGDLREKAKLMVGASTLARRGAEDDQFTRLRTAMG